jgi:hypothetical protein
MAHDHHASFLVVILDIDPAIWKHRSLFLQDHDLLLTDAVKELIIFCNAYALLHRRNKIAILGNHPNKVERIFPVENPSSLDDFIPVMHQLGEIVAENTFKYASYDKLETPIGEDYERKAAPSASNLSNALSMSLCSKLHDP